MPSIDEASGAVGGNAETAHELSGAIAGSKETISQLAGALAGLGVEAKAVEANGAAEDAERLAGQANALADALDALRARIEGIRGLLPGSGGSGKPPVAVGDPAAPAHGHGLPLPPLVSRLSDRLPEWTRGQPARAFAYSEEDGSELELRSGSNPEAKAGLKFEYRSRYVMDHIESHLAGRIRAEEGPRHVTLVINKEPCPGFKGCDATLPDLLPVGTSVSIYVKSGGGTTFYKTYEGTGRGIA